MSPTRSTPPSALIGLKIAALFVVVATIALRIVSWPLGVLESHALTGLTRSTAALDISWAAWTRTLGALYDAAYPAISLFCSALLVYLWPDVDPLWALRLPDAIAAVGLVLLVYRIVGRGDKGVTAALWVFVAVVAALGSIVSPGTGVNQFAIVLLLACFQAGEIENARVRSGLGVAIGASVLLLNGAGVYAIAVLVGAWAHKAIVERDARLWGSYRWPMLASIGIAALTLTPILDWPRATHIVRFVDRLNAGIQANGVPIEFVIGLMLWLGFVPFAIRHTITAFDGWAGRTLLIGLIGIGLTLTAGTTPPTMLASLAPIAALWLFEPVSRPDNHDSTGIDARWSRWGYAVVFAFQALSVAIASMWFAKTGEAVFIAWVVAFAIALLLMIGARWAWRYRDRSNAADRAGLSMALLALVLAVVDVFDTPVRVVPQRIYDRDLAHDLYRVIDRPIAVLAPVEADFWRVSLDRPLYAASDESSLCRWVKSRAASSRPIVLARPAATDSILASWPGSLRALQSPGTPETSVMVIDIQRSTVSGCTRPDNAATGKLRETD